MKITLIENEMTREKYMNGKITHDEYYRRLAELLDIRITRDDFFKGYSLITAYATDKHLNNIPLKLWDRQADIMIRVLGTKVVSQYICRNIDACWGSQADYVCVLKAAARKYIESMV